MSTTTIQSGGIRARNKANTWFIKSKEAKRFKQLQRRMLSQLHEKEVNLEMRHDEMTTEERVEFRKTVDRIMSQSPKNTTHRVNRRQLFTPESALSVLPSLQIATMAPTENMTEGKKRYRDKLRLKSQLDKERIKINSPVSETSMQPKVSKEPRTEKLNISLSSRADE